MNNSPVLDVVEPVVSDSITNWFYMHQVLELNVFSAFSVNQ